MRSSLLGAGDHGPVRGPGPAGPQNAALRARCPGHRALRPGEVIDEGLDRLCWAVTAQPPEAACTAVMGALAGSEPAHLSQRCRVFRRGHQAIRATAPQRERNFVRV